MQKLKDDAKAWREAQIVREYIEALRERAEADGTAELGRVGVGAGGGDGAGTQPCDVDRT